MADVEDVAGMNMATIEGVRSSPPTQPDDAITARLTAPGPKRMLALDGGGVKGIVTLAFLEQLEKELQAELGRGDDFVLSDYFDMIGGTSVGAIIATFLALGWRVEKMKERFDSMARKIFRPRLLGSFSGGLLLPHYDTRILRDCLFRELFYMTLGSPDLKTGLCILAKRIDTGSVWVLNNNRNGRHHNYTGGFRLVDILEASAAAPTYFSPKHIRFFETALSHQLPEEDGQKATFVDGAISPHNNPALQLLMMAGIRGYNLNWPLGASNLSLVSIGTGSFAHTVKTKHGFGLGPINALQGMVTDGQDLALTLLQWMSDTEQTKTWHIDRAMGRLEGDVLGQDCGLEEPLLSFRRYDVRLEDDWLMDHVGLTYQHSVMQVLRDFTDPDAINMLHDIASRAARKHVSAGDIPERFHETVWQGTEVV
ncbi:MAG: patatin-like phospholipase family protein [Pseudomonadota bacterium]